PLVLAFAGYTLVYPYFKRICLWDGNCFLVVFAGYFVVRLIYLAWYLILILARWDQKPAPFEFRRANLRTRGESFRHVLWAYFLGNVGLTVRAGVQAAFLFSFDAARSAL